MKIEKLIISTRLLEYLEQKSQKNQEKIETSKDAIREYRVSQRLTRDLLYCELGQNLDKPYDQLDQAERKMVAQGRKMFAETGNQIRTEQKKLTKLEKKASRIDGCKTRVKRRITKKNKK